MNTEQISFIHFLKIEPCNLGFNILDFIDETIKNTSFIKENYCVLSIDKTKLLSVQITNGQSECIAKIEISGKCVRPVIGKLLKGSIVQIVHEHKLTRVSIEGKLDVIVKNQKNDLHLFDTVSVEITGNPSISKGKMYCSGKILD